MAVPLPITIRPAARPRRSRRNQWETRTMTGMLARPLPMPIRAYSASTAPKPLLRLIPSMQKAISSRPETMTARGRKRRMRNGAAATETR